MATNSNRFSFGVLSNGLFLSKRLNDLFRRRPHPVHAPALRQDDGAQAFYTPVHVVVDDNVVVGRVVADFPARHLEATPDLFLAVLAAAAQALLEDSSRRRQDE